MSLCPKCGNSTFTASIESVKNLNMQVAFINCNACNTVVGVLDLTTTDNVKDLIKKVK